jgi:hypothetical protein
LVIIQLGVLICISRGYISVWKGRVRGECVCVYRNQRTYVDVVYESVSVNARAVNTKDCTAGAHFHMKCLLHAAGKVARCVLWARRKWGINEARKQAARALQGCLSTSFGHRIQQQHITTHRSECQPASQLYYESGLRVLHRNKPIRQTMRRAAPADPFCWRPACAKI